VVVRVVVGSFGGDLGDGGADGAFVDDGLVGGERGDECLEGEVVDRAGVAAAGLVDQGGGVVGEQGVAASGEGEVVAQLAGGFLVGHGWHGVAQSDALVQGC
jgi:hypothetical protein